MSSKVTFGVIGCSEIAKKSAIPALKNSKRLRIQIIGSRNNLKAKKFSQEFSIPEFGSYEEVLENNEINAVYISLPISLHEKWVIKAAKAGKHILCEKSSTISKTSAKKMLKECKKNNVRIMENFVFKFHPQHKKILEVIRKNTIGNVNSFHGKYGFNLSATKNNFRWNKKLGGGSLNDVGCYLVAASQFVFKNMPVAVFSDLKINKNSKVDESGHVMITYPNNKTANFSFGYKNYFQSMYEIWGEKGIIRTERAFNVKNNMPVSLKLQQNDKIKSIKIKAVNQFQLAMEGFANEIQCKKKQKFEEDLLEQALIMDAIRESAIKRKTIFFR